MARILVVDDDGIVRDALFVFLTRDGHEVETASDGAAGVRAFRKYGPDLVVLDRDLPVMSGSAVFDAIRRISGSVPILILSGYDDPEDVDAYMRGGAFAFLSKSGGLSPVLAAIDRLLGVKRGPDARPSPAEKRPAPQSVRKESPAGCLLIADDDAEIRTVLRRFLGPLFREVFEAADGAEALRLARAKKPDLVLLDINMPGVSGVSVLHELVPDMPGTGFMMITGNEDEAVARECLESGAFDYVSKPINLDALGTAVKARLLLQK
ncbi:MAG TPA: response regulator [Elusimicrobiales bacterium]|nr:response regulator [Elusimicrobiales bacterium]